MSWSISGSKGSKVAVLRRIGEEKIHGTPSDEEKDTFEKTRTMLTTLVESAPEGDEHNLIAISASAGGHGTSVTTLSFMIEYVQLK